jgi:hypothetical protein
VRFEYTSPQSFVSRPKMSTATDKIYYSPYPNVDLPQTSCWHFVFDHENRPADDKVVYVDGLTERVIK